VTAKELQSIEMDTRGRGVTWGVSTHNDSGTAL